MENFTPIPGFLFKAWITDSESRSSISLQSFNKMIQKQDEEQAKLMKALEQASDQINEELDGDAW